jgi:hypothetical protein
MIIFLRTEVCAEQAAEWDEIQRGSGHSQAHTIAGEPSTSSHNLYYHQNTNNNNNNNDDDYPAVWVEGQASGQLQPSTRMSINTAGSELLTLHDDWLLSEFNFYPHHPHDIKASTCSVVVGDDSVLTSHKPNS